MDAVLVMETTGHEGFWGMERHTELAFSHVCVQFQYNGRQRITWLFEEP